MSTFKEENAITYRIAQMQAKWGKEVDSKAQLIRWLVQKDEVRMVKIFSMTEASKEGKLPELFLNFDQPFRSMETYGKDLVDGWLALWNDQKAREKVAHAGVLPDWDDTPYHNVTEKNSAWTFIKCMSSFASAIDPKITLILNIMPQAYTISREFAMWVEKCLKSLPSNIKFMVVDLEDHQQFKNIPNYINHTTLVANLKMQEAIKEIVKSGDSSNPGVGVNLCLLNIAEATNAKDEKEINRWGNEGIEIAKETGLKSIEATVFIAHGCAFYQLKKFDKALALFKKAEDTSIEGIKAEDPTAPILLLQSYNIQAGTYLYKKKYELSKEYYLKTANEAKSQNNTIMLIEAYRQAAYVAHKDYETEEAYKLLQVAYTAGVEIEREAQKFSSMLLICIKLHEYADLNKNEKLVRTIENHATDIWGEHWQDISQQEVHKQIVNS